MCWLRGGLRPGLRGREQVPGYGRDGLMPPRVAEMALLAQDVSEGGGGRD
jgi:hypothetical protein